MTERGARRPGVSLLGTAAGQDEAADWQRRLVEAGVQSVVRGHRDAGSTERRPKFSGVDVFVPATHLAYAREVILPVAAPGQVVVEDERPFPWGWLFAVPVALLAGAAIVVIAAIA